MLTLNEDTALKRHGALVSRKGTAQPKCPLQSGPTAACGLADGALQTTTLPPPATIFSWWYPFPLRPAASSLLEGEQTDSGLVLTPPTFLTKRTTDKPIWVGLQAYKRPRVVGAPYPTPAEYRAQAYLAIIHRARGLIRYGASVTGGLFRAPGERHWEELKELAGELRSLAPVLTAPSLRPPAVLRADAPVSVTLMHASGLRVFLSASCGLPAHDVTLVLPGLGSGGIRAWNENRTVTANNGRIQDRFDPLAVHVYELPAD